MTATRIVAYISGMYSAKTHSLLALSHGAGTLLALLLLAALLLSVAQ
ncbi:hypothetical protein [Undibacterium sp. 10I3]|nr:hypothetical protein [Undibacterium sp. 10I3]MEB0229857.1 hypothetical protein [Undibacterium sp. 10I3]